MSKIKLMRMLPQPVVSLKFRATLLRLIDSERSVFLMRHLVQLLRGSKYGHENTQRYCFNFLNGRCCWKTNDFSFFSNSSLCSVQNLLDFEGKDRMKRQFVLLVLLVRVVAAAALETTCCQQASCLWINSYGARNKRKRIYVRITFQFPKLQCILSCKTKYNCLISLEVELYLVLHDGKVYTALHFYPRTMIFYLFIFFKSKVLKHAFKNKSFLLFT